MSFRSPLWKSGLARDGGAGDGVDARPPVPPGNDLSPLEIDATRAHVARLEALFHAALARPSRARAAWLRARCPDDPQLADEVLALLAADAAAVRTNAPLSRPAGSLADLLAATGADGEFTDGTNAAVWGEPRAEGEGEREARRLSCRRATPPIAPGDRIGVYRVLRLLGRGGMGAVYLVEREDVGARAALKVVRATLARNARARARLLAERRALARLAHPHIARLLDAGTVEGGPADGAPWFAMEYVDGLPLDVACDARRLGIRERLALFTDVCGAVDAAHQQGVVHRDIKPSNVLVTAGGRAMLVDFGVAAVLDGPLHPADAPAWTATSSSAPNAPDVPDAPNDAAAWASAPLGLLTPQYAAPEQVRGEPPSVGADVYALGLLLFEVLTGRRPYEVRGPSRGDAVRTVLSARVPRPSELVSVGDDAEARADARGTHPAALRRMLRGDLDAIASRALAKDPAVRYPTASALCDDVRRVLAHEPVAARLSHGVVGITYRAARFARRHRAAAAVVIAVAATVAVGVVEYAREARVARAERERALVAAARATQVRNLLLGLFDVVPPDSAGGHSGPRSPEALLRRGERAADALAAQPDVQADLLVAVGRAWVALGDPATGARVLRRAVELRRRRLAPHDPLVTDAIGQLAGALAAADRMRAARLP